MIQQPHNYADPAQTTYITASMLRFGIEYLRLQNDEDICIHVFRRPDDQQDEVLRFDCFQRQPTTMPGPRMPLCVIEPAAEGDPLQWTLTHLWLRLPAS